jgi:hypothetical protein
VEIFYALRDIFLCIESSHYIGVTTLFWFLPCLFMADLIMWFVNKFMRKISYKNSLEIIYFLIFCIFVFISFIENKLIHFRLYFTLDTALLAVSFICLGYSSKKIVDWCYKQKTGIQLLFIIAGLFGLLSVVKLNTDFLMFTNQYGNYLYAIIGAVSGMFFFCNLVFISRNYLPKSGLLFLSTNSLVFYPVHLMILALLSKILSYITFTPEIIFIVPLIKVVFTVVLLIPCIWYINKYLPIMAGRKYIM